MVTVSGPPPQFPNPSMAEETDEVDIGKMDGLLEELRTSMVELIVQGDDVTQQMWRMYSVFEEIFGRQTMTTSSNQPLKHVVVGDRLKGAATPHKAPSSPPAPATATTTTASATAAATTGQLSSPTPVCTTPKDVKEALPEEDHSSTSPQNKVPQFPPVQPLQTPSPKSSAPTASSRSSPGIPSGQVDAPSLKPTSNPLLDTIGALANSNPDSDDSDLDMVYQQLRYRGRKQEQMRMRTHRTHRHHQVASSDPESIGYAGSNSIDSGYKSLCATPEVSDSLGAPEVRRSASDVSASDSSTTSGRPRSLDGKSGKIKMGTRSSAGKLKPMDRSPRQVAMNDVTLDHLMYLRQSLRKDRPDAQRSPNDSIPSSATSSTFRDSDLSPRTLTDEEWRDTSSRSPAYSLRQTASSSPDTSSRSPAYSLRQTASSSPDTSSRSPAYPLRQQASNSSSPDTSCRSPAYSLRQTARSSPDTTSRSPAYPLRLPSSSSPDPFARGSTVDQEGGGESSSDYLLSGVEYYDLESIQEFPSTNNYVTMLEEKTRCARFQVVQAPRSSEPLTERQLSSLYRKRSDSTQSVDGDVSRCHPLHSQNIYGLAGHHHHRNSAKALASRHHQNRQHHATDSKLTEAAIRVLEMIEDFRMEEAITRSGRVLQPPPEYHHHQGPSYHQPAPSRAYKKSSRRPASTGSLMEHEIDARSVASSSAEHHVYEEIMYDLVCERGQRGGPPPVPPGRIASGGRTRLLPVPPQAYASASRVLDPRRIMVRSHKHSSSNMYSVMSGGSVHGRSNVDRFLEMEWQDRRESLPPDFPV